MDPEQRLLVIVECLSVEFKILILSTVIRSLGPKRMYIIKKLWTTTDLELLFFRLLVFFLLVFFLLVIRRLSLFLDFFNYYVTVKLLRFLNNLCSIFFCLGKVDFVRHE